MENQESGSHLSPRAGRRLAWLAVIGLMIGLTAFYEALTRSNVSVLQETGKNGQAIVSLQRNRAGHYIAEGEINGNPVVFLLDTGATDVAISDKTARALGLEFGPRITVMTAAGPAAAWRTRLDRVSLGSLALDNVRATITPGLGREALLGMSFLQYFNLRQEGDQLVLQGMNQTD